MRTSLDAPDHTTLSRRGQVLNIAVHQILARGPLHLIVDSTGLSVVGADLIGAAADLVASVTGDAAYDTVAFYEAASARHAPVVVPPIMTARVSRHGPRSRVRDRAITGLDPTMRIST